MKTKDLLIFTLLALLLLRFKKSKKANPSDAQGVADEQPQDQGQSIQQGGDAPSDNEPQQIFGVGAPSGGGGGITMPSPVLPSQISTEQTSVTTFIQPNFVSTSPKPTPKPIKATIISDQPDLTPVSIKSVANISACGNEFVVVSGSPKLSATTRYWWDGNNYYMQSSDGVATGVPVKISFTQYDNACKQLMAGPAPTMPAQVTQTPSLPQTSTAPQTSAPSISTQPKSVPLSETSIALTKK